MVKVILWSLGAFPIFDNLVPWRWRVVERNGVQFGPQGWVFSVYRILVKLNDSGNSGGHSVYIWVWTTLCRKQQVLEWNIHLSGCMGSPLMRLHLTSVTFERLMTRSLRFWKLKSRKGAELGHMLLSKINRKPYVGSPKTLSHLTLSDLERSVNYSDIRCYSDFEPLYLVKEQS